MGTRNGKSRRQGTDFDFDISEKKKAQAASTTINIGTIGAFTGNLGAGNVAADISSREIDARRVGEFLEQLHPRTRELGSSDQDVDRLEEKLHQIKSAINSGGASATLRNLLTDAKAIIVGGAGNLVATGAMTALNAILGTGVPPT